MTDAATGAWETVKKWIDEQRLGHAYIIEGAVQERGIPLTHHIIRYLLKGDPHGPPSVPRHHADVHWISPRSKSRVIRVEDMQHMMMRLSQTSYEGGWKFGVIEMAERLNPQAANKFLKTLEEPPPKTLLLLLTETPGQLLDTIRSRCQTIKTLPLTQSKEVPDWHQPLLALLETGMDLDPATRFFTAQHLAQILEACGKSISLTAEDQREKKEMEALAQASATEEHQRVLLAIEKWLHDIALAHHGVPPKHYPAFSKTIQKQSELYSIPALCERFKAVENIRINLERNFRPTDAIEAAWL